MDINDLKQSEIQGLIDNLEKEIEKYRRGFNILIEYFDSIPDEDKPQIDDELNKLGL